MYLGARENVRLLLRGRLDRAHNSGQQSIALEFPFKLTANFPSPRKFSAVRSMSLRDFSNFRTAIFTLSILSVNEAQL